MPIRPKDVETRKQEAEILEDLKLSTKTFLLLQSIQARQKIDHMQTVLDLAAKRIATNDQTNLQALVIEIFKESAMAREADWLTDYYIPTEVKWLNEQRAKEKSK